MITGKRESSRVLTLELIKEKCASCGISMASRTAALRTRNVVSPMRKHSINTAKAGVIAAAMGVMLIAIKFPAADRRPVVQAGNIQEEYDVTISATLEAQEGEGARKSRTQDRTTEGGGAAVARWSPADGPDWLELSHREQPWGVAMGQFEPQMAPGTGGSDGGGTGTRRCTAEGVGAAATEQLSAESPDGLELSNRQHPTPTHLIP
jgi:hypothetical protein